MPALPSWLTNPCGTGLCAAARMRPRPPRPPRPPAWLPPPPRRRPDLFDKLLQVLVFGCGYRKIADATCSATTIRDRRDRWIALGVFDRLEAVARGAHQVRREALCRIPGPAGRDLEGGSWVEWLTWIRKVKGTTACQQPGGWVQMSGTARREDPRDMAKAGLPEA
jgi:transposase